MTPTVSKSLEEKITGLLASLAVTNEGVMNLTKISERHENFLFGKDDNGGIVSRMNTTKAQLDEHERTLQRLEDSCSKVVTFMESQVEINKAQAATNATLNKVLYGLAGLVFLILLLIGVADISALHSLLTGIHFP